MKATLAIISSVPRPMWMPLVSPSPTAYSAGIGRKARTVSKVSTRPTSTAAYQNQRWTFCRISGNRVSPE